MTVYFISIQKNQPPAIYKIRVLYLKDIRIDKTWSLLSKNLKPSGGKGSEQLSTTQDISVLIEMCTRCFKSTMKKREQLILTGNHKEGATDVHTQVLWTGRAGKGSGHLMQRKKYQASHKGPSAYLVWRNVNCFMSLEHKVMGNKWQEVKI